MSSSSLYTPGSNAAVKHQPLQTADAARKLAELVDFAKSFASDSDINTVVGIVNQDLDLKDCLQRKEEEVAALQHRVDSDNAKFNDTLQANLAAYGFSKDKLKGELEDSRNEIRALKDKVGQDEHAMKALKENEAKLQYETERLLETSRAQKDKAKSDLTKIRELEGSLGAAGKDKVTLQTQLQQEESSHTQAKSGFANLQQMFNKLEKEYNSLLQERQLAQSLSVTLTKDDPEQL
jgi:chromosome segregation ATPase